MTGHQVYRPCTPIRRPARSPGFSTSASFHVLAGNIIASSRKRLVRRDCAKHCKQAHQRAPAMCSMVERGRSPADALYRAVAATNANIRANRGRMAIIEILKMTASSTN